MNRHQTNRMRRKGMASLAFICLICACSVGCGLAPKATLGYEGPVCPSGSFKSVPVVVCEFQDLRADKRVGIILNLFDGVESGIESKNEVGRWMSEALAKELRHRGFYVCSGRKALSVDDPKRIVVKGDILTLNTFQPSGLMVYCRTLVAVRIYRDNRLLYERHFEGKHDLAATTWDIGAEQVAAGCEKAVQDMMHGLVPTVDRQILYAAGAASSDAVAEEVQQPYRIKISSAK
ncbi:MAG TPA: hypothetical protein PL033_04095 [Candidatus Brocadiia bacterium]|nr:hypothetical protein [Candidatus Brocadiia bacterium]